MAIDLNKDHYNSKNNNDDNIRTVYPETESEEIYPERDIFPDREVYPQQEISPKSSPAAENVPAAGEVYPQGEVRHIETAQECALTNPPHNDIINKKEKKHKKKKHRGWIFWVVLVALIAMVSNNYKEISSYVYTNFMDGSFAETTKDFSAAGIKTLTLTDSNSDVTIKSSSDDEFHITVNTPDDKTYDMKSENGGITVNGSKSTGVFMTWILSSEVTLYIPDSYEGDIVIDSKNTSIECSAGSNLDISNTNGKIGIYDIDGTDIRIKNDNASVTLTDVTADTVKAETKNSSITAEKVTAAILDLNAKNATVNAEGCTASEYASLYSGNGSVKAERCAFYISGSLISQNGSVNADDCIFTGNSVINSDNGRVSLEDFSFENMMIKSKNGSIDCEAYGNEKDYCITASAKNGSSDVPNGGNGEYYLDLSADNGRIEFDFDGSKPIL
ncbi:MAG: DUF4097 family beta strand repeat-containing protein [Oscillospiraceae bacterium]|nr:DUF4097 family beta strand repeat-containing protein [Oscillospiraceae bacterium]